jgi:hypothetical protein
VQIIIPEANPLLPPLYEVVVVRRVAPEHPRGRGRPLGEPPPSPDPARVWSLSARNERKKTTVDR